MATHKNMCISDHPTDSDSLTLYLPTDSGFFIVRLYKLFYWGSYRKRNEVNRTTLREVMSLVLKTKFV